MTRSASASFAQVIEDELTPIEIPADPDDSVVVDLSGFTGCGFLISKLGGAGVFTVYTSDSPSSGFAAARGGVEGEDQYTATAGRDFVRIAVDSKAVRRYARIHLAQTTAITGWFVAAVKLDPQNFEGDNIEGGGWDLRVESP